ncbi:MAG: hypothetical protein PHI32_09100 [Dysgonamonadaceae bacterium]|nr:hypothetical protein [Dysgonamonadaceae bacterium]
MTEKRATRRPTQERFNFCPTALKKGKKGQADPAIFCHGFCPASFSTFAG